MEGSLPFADDRSALASHGRYDDLLAALTHELLTPLTSVVGHTELVLESTSLNEEDRQCLERIQLGSDQLARRLQVLVEGLPTIVLEGPALEELVARVSRL